VTVAVLIASFFGLLLIGVPVAVALGGSAMLTMILFTPTSRRSSARNFSPTSTISP